MATSIYSRKTKDELIQAIEGFEDHISDLKKQVATLERYKQYETAANEMMALKESFVRAGFTDAQAYEMMLTVLKDGMRQISRR